MIMGNCSTFTCSQNSEFSDIRVLYQVKFPKLIPKKTPQGVRKERDISGLDGAYRSVAEFPNHHKYNQKASCSSPTQMLVKRLNLYEYN